MYLLEFTMIDKVDEYQLVNFILLYKKYQFLTLGVVQIVFGYTLFYLCTELADPDDQHGKAQCVERGPGSWIADYLEYLGFFT